MSPKLSSIMSEIFRDQQLLIYTVIALFCVVSPHYRTPHCHCTNRKFQMDKLFAEGIDNPNNDLQ